MRQFAGPSLTRPIPDETTILNFWRALKTDLVNVRGKAGHTYVALALRARKFTKRQGAPSPNLLKLWGHCVWILRGINPATGDQESQATAFSVENLGIVTAAHAFTPFLGDGLRWEIRPAWDPNTTYPVTAIQFENTTDMALLQTTAPIDAVLVASQLNPIATSPV